jgi:hypothetical protein
VIDIFSPRLPETPTSPPTSLTPWWCSDTSSYSTSTPHVVSHDGPHRGELALISSFPVPPSRSWPSSTHEPAKGDAECALAEKSPDDLWGHRGEEEDDDDSSDDARTITAATPNSASTGYSGWSAVWSEVSSAHTGFDTGSDLYSHRLRNPMIQMTMVRWQRPSSPQLPLRLGMRTW